MVISVWLAALIFILASLGISGFLIFLYFRFRRKSYPVIDRLTVIISFIAGFVFWMFSNSLQNHIAEITSTELKEYVAVGTSVITASDGHDYIIDQENFYEYCVINTTDEDLVKDYISYGIGIDFGTVTLFPAHSFDYMSSLPDYMPWETPPNEVQSTIPMSMRLWIRRPEPDDEYTHE